MTIAVTGSTGQVGSEFVKVLRKEVAQMRLLQRKPSAAEAIYFDFCDPKSYAPALADCERLFLVCCSSFEKQLPQFLEVVQDAAIQQIVFISGMGAEVNREKFLSRVENLLIKTGIPSIFLRANWFYQNFGTFFYAMLHKEHCLRFPDGGASYSFVDARDIAEVAAYFITNKVEPGYQAFNITGPESLTHAAVAQLFSQHLPYQVTYEELTEQQAQEQLGWDGEWLALFRDIRQGLVAPVSQAVPQILGRPARMFEEYIAEYWL